MDTRIEVLQQIDKLQDNHCQSCKRKDECKQCPFGLELAELGQKLNQITRPRKNTKLEVKPMAKPKFTLTEEQFNAERAAGKSVASIAKEQGVSEVTIYNHIGKWAEARKPGQDKLLREKDVSPPGPPSAELLDKAEKEIERLTTENQRLDQRMVSAQNEATKAWTEVEQLRDKLDNSDREWTKQVDKWQEKNMVLIKERDDLFDEVNRMGVQIADLEEMLNQQESVNAVPVSEVQRLDTAIQDLTRARWILNRLSASGE